MLLTVMVVACLTELNYLLPGCDDSDGACIPATHTADGHGGKRSTPFDNAQFRKSGIADCVNLMALGEARQGLETAW
jgi:hypothetical protein